MGETIIQPVIDRPCPKCFCWSLAVDCRVPDVVYCERCAPAPFELVQPAAGRSIG